MHIPVLFQESIDALHIRNDGVYVDGTLGGAGHALAIAQHLGPHGTLIGFDVDSHAIARAREKLQGVSCRVILIQDNFRNLTDAVKHLLCMIP
jgi:16S rRNA (cytosine1402-N4)-methyltransferase